MQSFGDPTQHREDHWLGQGDFGVRYMLATLGRFADVVVSRRPEVPTRPTVCEVAGRAFRGARNVGLLTSAA